MKKSVSIIIAVCLLLCVCGCGKNEQTGGENFDKKDYSKITADSIELFVRREKFAQSVEYQNDNQIITLAEVTSKNKVASDYIEKQANEHKIDTVSRENVSASVPDKRTINVFGISIEAQYRDSSIGSKEIGANAFNRRDDEYYYKPANNHRESWYFSYLNGTDEIINFFRIRNNDSSPQIPNELYNEQQVRQKAESFIYSFISEEEFEKYSFKEIYYPQQYIGYNYVVRYVNLVHGYESDDVIEVEFSSIDDELLKYSRKGSEKYDDFEETTEKELIDAVVSATEEKLNSFGIENMKTQEIKLVTDIYGTVYVRFFLTYGASDIYDFVYAKIDPKYY